MAEIFDFWTHKTGLEQVNAEFERRGIAEKHYGLARLIYQVPGCQIVGETKYGNLDYNQTEFFKPDLEGHLCLEALPQEKHIPGTVNAIFTKTDSYKAEFDVEYLVTTINRNGKVTEAHHSINYQPSIDLKKYWFSKNEEGLDIVRLHIKIIDYTSFKFPDVRSLDIENNKGLYEDCRRCFKRLQDFWTELEQQFKNCTLRHGFKYLDLEKAELKRKTT